MTQLYSGANGWKVIHAVHIKRADERKLVGVERQADAILLASGVEQAKEIALAAAQLSEAIIAEFGLRDPRLDVFELLEELNRLSDEQSFEVELYETDADIVDRLFNR